MYSVYRVLLCEFLDFLLYRSVAFGYCLEALEVVDFNLSESVHAESVSVLSVLFEDCGFVCVPYLAGGFCDLVKAVFHGFFSFVFVTQIYRKQPQKSMLFAKKNTQIINKNSPSKLTKNTHFSVENLDPVSDVFDLDGGHQLTVSADYDVAVFRFELNGTASAVQLLGCDEG